MKIGSHDSMSYATPERWYLRPFHFVARCQSKTIEEQYEDYGIRLFDMRVRWDDKAHCWKFAHGFMTFKTAPVEEVFAWLNSKKDVYVRLILEYNRPVKNQDEVDELFVKSCEKWNAEFTDIKWFEFTRKYDWKRMFYNDVKAPSMYQASSSTTCLMSVKFPWLDDWWPWLYAKLQNRDNVRQGTTAEYLLLDFVEMR